MHLGPAKCVVKNSKSRFYIGAIKAVHSLKFGAIGFEMSDVQENCWCSRKRCKRRKKNSQQQCSIVIVLHLRSHHRERLFVYNSLGHL